jgi:hypothetical protein
VRADSPKAVEVCFVTRCEVWSMGRRLREHAGGGRCCSGCIAGQWRRAAPYIKWRLVQSAKPAALRLQLRAFLGPSPQMRFPPPGTPRCRRPAPAVGFEKTISPGTYAIVRGLQVMVRVSLCFADRTVRGHGALGGVRLAAYACVGGRSKSHSLKCRMGVGESRGM